MLNVSFNLTLFLHVSYFNVTYHIEDPQRMLKIGLKELRVKTENLFSPVSFDFNITQKVIMFMSVRE